MISMMYLYTLSSDLCLRFLPLRSSQDDLLRLCKGSHHFLLVPALLRSGERGLPSDSLYGQKLCHGQRKRYRAIVVSMRPVTSILPCCAPSCKPVTIL
jgi:hypothetical protein